jgi:hypothetical protein
MCNTLVAPFKALVANSLVLTGLAEREIISMISWVLKLTQGPLIVRYYNCSNLTRPHVNDCSR